MAEPDQAFVALYFSVNDTPSSALRVMEAASERKRLALRSSNRVLGVVFALILLGWVGFLFDFAAGFDSFVFGYFGLICWASALMLRRSVERRREHLLAGGVRARKWLVIPAFVQLGVATVVSVVAALNDAPVALLISTAVIAVALSTLTWERAARAKLAAGSPFDSRFDEARQVFAALKDDLPRKYPLLGWLDLTGLSQPKLLRRDRAAGGAPLVFYRDEWLRLKLKLWDGNVLRLSAIESIRKKEGFWKRGSRKSKWKPGATTARHQLKISVVVDARTHVIRRPAQQQRLDRLWLEAEVATDDRLVLCAYADDRLNAQHLLGAMKLAYDHVMPRTSAG
ncbi:MAG TPA: hypothetical protein VG937_30665 [Polyangiaceae bacterium]|nr:hypothetical protein [Polyangiaceae bacterium]